ncbi:hypothetical protein [Bacillus tequilensis]
MQGISESEQAMDYESSR